MLVPAPPNKPLGAEQLDRQKDRQTDRQADRQTGRQTDRQIDKQTNIQTDNQTDRHPYSLAAAWARAGGVGMQPSAD